MKPIVKILLIVVAAGLFIAGLVMKSVMPVSMTLIIASVILFAFVLRGFQNRQDPD